MNISLRIIIPTVGSSQNKFPKFSETVSCGDGRRYPSCSLCPNTNSTNTDTWCNRNCYFDKIEGTCKEKGSSA